MARPRKPRSRPQQPRARSPLQTRPAGQVHELAGPPRPTCLAGLEHELDGLHRPSSTSVGFTRLMHPFNCLQEPYLQMKIKNELCM